MVLRPFFTVLRTHLLRKTTSTLPLARYWNESTDLELQNSTIQNILKTAENWQNPSLLGEKWYLCFVFKNQLI